MVSPPLSKAPLLFEEMLLHVIVIIAFLLPVGSALPLTWDFLHQPRCPLPQVPRGHRGVGGLWLRSKRGDPSLSEGDRFVHEGLFISFSFCPRKTIVFIAAVVMEISCLPKKPHCGSSL